MRRFINRLPRAITKRSVLIGSTLLQIAAFGMFASPPDWTGLPSSDRLSRSEVREEKISPTQEPVVASPTTTPTSSPTSPPTVEPTEKSDTFRSLNSFSGQGTTESIWPNAPTATGTPEDTPTVVLPTPTSVPTVVPTPNPTAVPATSTPVPQPMVMPPTQVPPTTTPVPQPMAMSSPELYAAGQAAYYSSGIDWYSIYYLQTSWGNEAPGATGPSPSDYHCVHADIDQVGIPLLLIANGVSITCITADTVQEAHKAQWKERWAIELSWTAFTALGLDVNNYVEVYFL